MNIPQERIEDAESILKTQGADGNWNLDPYMHGMLNGMIIMKATLLGGKSNFRDAPSEWHGDKQDKEKEPIVIEPNA